MMLRTLFCSIDRKNGAKLSFKLIPNNWLRPVVILKLSVAIVSTKKSYLHFLTLFFMINQIDKLKKKSFLSVHMCAGTIILE